MTDAVLEVSLLRMRATQLASTLAAQLASRLRPLAVAAGVQAIRVSDDHSNALLVEALLADGFGAHAGGQVGIAVGARCAMAELPATIAAAVAPLTDSEKQAVTVADLAARLTAGSDPGEVAAVERQARPLRVLDAPIDTWIVPIKPAWSSQLFNVPADLIGQTPELGISVEHVYYRGGRSGETAPARVLWYVSDDAKGRSGSVGKMVIGCSELMEVRDGTPTDLHRRFRRLGVYGWKEVNDCADERGRVRALRVINTEIFARPIALQRLRHLAAEEGQTVQLVSPKRISAGLFARIVQEGYA